MTLGLARGALPPPRGLPSTAAGPAPATPPRPGGAPGSERAGGAAAAREGRRGERAPRLHVGTGERAAAGPAACEGKPRP